MLEAKIWVAVLLFAVLLLVGCATPIEIPGTNDSTGGNFKNSNAPSADAGVKEKDARVGLDDTYTGSDSAISDYGPIQPPPGDMAPDHSANDGTTGDGAGDGAGDATGDASPADGLLDVMPDSSADLSGDGSADLSTD